MCEVLLHEKMPPPPPPPVKKCPHHGYSCNMGGAKFNGVSVLYKHWHTLEYPWWGAFFHANSMKFCPPPYYMNIHGGGIFSCNSPKQKEGFLFMMNSYPEFTFNINSSLLSNEATEYVHFLEVISNAIW